MPGAEAFLDLVPHNDRESLLEPGAEARLSVAIASGPVPPALLLRFARETGFSGIDILERAAVTASGKEDLFAGPPDKAVPVERPAASPQVEVDPAALESSIDRDIR